MGNFFQDLKFALRSLGKTPGFTAVVALTLGLGIGANTAVFSVVYGVVMRPLSYPEPEQLVRITTELRGLRATDTGMAALELFDFQSRTDLFSGVCGLYPIDANVTGGEAPERVEVMLVSWNYFSILGARPQLGRVFGIEDNAPGIPEATVVSDGYWRRRLGADPNVLGRRLLVDGDPVVVVGVMPPGFKHPGRTVQTEVDMWAPAGYRALPFGPPDRMRRMLNGALARLQPDVTIASAQAQLDAYAAEMQRQFPDAYPAENGWNPKIVPLQEDVIGNVKPAMLVLLGAVGLVLLIACVNVANLILARSADRQQEMAIRQALGAGRKRLAQQMLTESACLAAAGGVLGLLLGAWAMDALVAIAPGRVPRLSEVGLDASAVGMTALLTLVTTFLFGLAPALQIQRVNSFEVLKEGGPGRSASGARARVRNLLVSAEVALAMILLVGAGLLIRSFWQLQQVDVGFNTENLLTARVWLPRPNDPKQGRYLVPENRVIFYREALRRVRELPGVESAAMATQVPLGGFNRPLFFEVEGRDVSAQAARPTAQSFQVSTSYFATLGIPLMRGRAFSETDRADTEPVVMVSESFVRAYLKDTDPVGKRLRFGSNAPWMTIIGVAGDVRNRRLEESAPPQIYRSLEQASNLTLAFFVRTSAAPAAMGEAISRELRAVDPDLPLYTVRTMDDLLSGAVAQRRFLMRLLAIFAATAVGLALLGIYGVISYSVAQRTREIGIRMALGARPGDVQRMVVGGGMRLALLGLAAGTLGALGLSRLIAAQLYGVQPSDPATLAAVLALMCAVAALAAYLPARRAARVDPMVALRHE